MNDKRYYRMADLQIRSQEEEKENDENYIVEGYASTFEPYVLWRDPDTEIEYIEQIDTKAFDETDMSDVVFRVDHSGPVYARTKNKLIELSVDDHGLFCRVDPEKQRLQGHYMRILRLVTTHRCHLHSQ